MDIPKVIVVVGPTASGKTALAIRIAKRYGGEIISADSRQVYRGLDLGTGKVTVSEMEHVPHHMLDVADPSRIYTASDFTREGRQVLHNIHSRGKLPVIAGGSFFYIDTLLGRVTLPEVPPDSELRAKLDSYTTSELYALLAKNDKRRAHDIDASNRPRIIRALEISAKLGAVPLPYTEPLYSPLILGITIDREELHKNIHDRIVTRMEAGMLEEVRKLHENGLSYDRLESLGLEYRYLAQHLRGDLSYCDMLSILETKTRQFAKRQMTWLKRDKEIQWVDKHDETIMYGLINEFLEK